MSEIKVRTTTKYYVDTPLGEREFSDLAEAESYVQQKDLKNFLRSAGLNHSSNDLTAFAVVIQRNLPEILNILTRTHFTPPEGLGEQRKIEVGS